MIVIGITGQTGAGKTTALHALNDLGGRTIDCDAVYHHLLATSEALLEDLEGRFGNLSDENGVFDRKKLGNIVFHDSVAMDDLNAITQQHILAAVADEIAVARRDGAPAVAIDAIRLIESGLGNLCQTIVAITAEEECRIARIMAREGIDREYAVSRVRAQQDEDFYRTHCAHILDSDGNTPEQFRARARTLFEKLLIEK